MDKFTTALVAFSLVALGFGIGAATIGLPKSIADKNADWTVPLCEVYANTSHPKLPAYTVTNICVTDDGRISHTDGTVSK